jgi:hypothetical protein
MAGIHKGFCDISYDHFFKFERALLTEMFDEIGVFCG